ncbi:MAG: hypothetical protein HOP21_07750 [Methylotenera sp.]|nr:hypothetical protein [Methylotenera sp.]
MIFPGEFYLADLEYLKENSSNKNVDMVIQALMVQIAESEDATWCLTQWKNDNKNPFFNVSAISYLQQQGYNIYRLRPLGSSKLNRYRVIYAFDSEYEDFYLLAVVEKAPENETEIIVHDRIYKYEHDHHIIKRVCKEYDAFGIPRNGNH